jgi:hypothetical protein
LVVMTVRRGQSIKMNYKFFGVACDRTRSARPLLFEGIEKASVKFIKEEDGVSPKGRRRGQSKGRRRGQSKNS